MDFFLFNGVLTKIYLDQEIMRINTVSLQKSLFYLYLLTYDDKKISPMSLKSIAISVYGSTMDKNLLIDGLKYRIASIMQDNFKDEITYEFSQDEFENINPKYYGKSITFHLRKIENEILISNVEY